MNPEQRLQALEEEVQLLKNQIQAILLEVQEQLLTNAYPALRANSPRSAEPPTPPTRSPLKSFNITTLEPDQPDDEVEVPTSKKAVQPRKTQALSNTPKALPAPSNGTRPEASSKRRKVVEPEPIDDDDDDEAEDEFRASDQEFEFEDENEGTEPRQLNWSTLENWARTKLEKLGAERTRKLIKLYTSRGPLSPGTQSALLEFVDRWDAAERASTMTTPQLSERSRAVDVMQSVPPFTTIHQPEQVTELPVVLNADSFSLHATDTYPLESLLTMLNTHALDKKAVQQIRQLDPEKAANTQQRKLINKLITGLQNSSTARSGAE